MRLDPDEISAIAQSLAPLVADILERRLGKTPQWAMSISAAAAWANVPEDAIRHAIRAGKLPAIKIGNQIRIRRADLFVVKREGPRQ